MAAYICCLEAAPQMVLLEHVHDGQKSKNGAEKDNLYDRVVFAQNFDANAHHCKRDNAGNGVAYGFVNTAHGNNSFLSDCFELWLS